MKLMTTLKTLLAETGDGFKKLDTGAYQVFSRSALGWKYYRLHDYVVSSAVSGPSLILVPRA